MAQPWHTLSVGQILSQLSSGLDGLTAAAAEKSRAEFGDNTLPPPRRRHGWPVFLDQFLSSMIYILVAAAAISFVFREWQDGLVISGVIILNAVIGFFQEVQASAALQRLLDMTPQFAQVMRAGQEQQLPVGQLVVGDVVWLTTGDQVPADGRWVEAMNVKVNESSMTGEAVPAEKITAELPAATMVQEQRNMSWRGTTLVAGRGRLLIVATGPQTRFGRLLAQLQTVDHTRTPMQEKLQVFSSRLALITVVIGLALFVLGLVRHLPVSQVFLLAVSMIVSIIPEGLPLVMTIATAAGVTAMAKRQVVVRHSVAVETLGAVTIVATDKTGTLTFGEMMVEKFLADGREYQFTGQGYAAGGEILLDNKKIMTPEHPALSLALKFGQLNNDARFAVDEHGQSVPIGDPTELALLVAGNRGGWNKVDVDGVHPRLGEFAFDHQKKYMVTWHREEHQTLVVVKGAPHEVLNLCRQSWYQGQVQELTPAGRAVIVKTYERWADEALRGLAIAYTYWPESPETISHAGLRGHLMFVGLAGMADAIRPEAGEALRLLLSAGIRTMMITGDHEKTGLAVGRRLGLIRGPGTAELIDGFAVDQLTDEQLAARLPTVTVGTRLTPEHKLRIATILKNSGQVVAMTGDGINDVPALLEADVGVAVGRQSSDAAKEAADLVLVDGNLLHLAEAVGEGRRILRNIQRVIIYLVASNFGELVLIVLALLFGYGPPLLPKHIIWLNAVTDPFLGVALAREQQSTTVMLERPHQRAAPLLSKAQWQRVIVATVTIGLSSFAVFLVVQAMGFSAAKSFAITLSSIALAEWILGVTLHSSKQSAFSRLANNRAMLVALATVTAMQAAILFIRPLQNVFGLAALGWYDLLIVIAGAMPILLIEELRKLFIRRHLAMTQPR